MPPLEPLEPDDPREGLNRARSNLLRAGASRGIGEDDHPLPC